MHYEQCLKKINIGTVALTVSISVFSLGILTFIVFALDGINVFTEKSLPAVSNPVTLIFVSLMFIVIVLYDKKNRKKGDIDKYAILYG